MHDGLRHPPHRGRRRSGRVELEVFEDLPRDAWSAMKAIRSRRPVHLAQASGRELRQGVPADVRLSKLDRSVAQAARRS